MLSKFTKHKKLLLTLLLVAVIAGGIFIWGAAQVKAETCFWGVLPCPGEIFTKLGAWIMYGVFYLFSRLVWLAALLLQAVFEVEKRGGYVNANIVQTGWQITRDLCNMFFALILLVMAFATILQIETFGMKRILWRLVVAALLINFSLVFAGIFIDFAGVLTQFFITSATDNGRIGIADQLANALNIQQQFRTPTNTLSESNIGTVIQNNQGGLLNFMVAMVFGVIVLLVAAFALFAAAIFFIIRIVALWLLLIFAPLAWVGMITGTGGLWNQWWSNFFKWTFFAPIYAFFLYLGVRAASSGLGTTFQSAAGVRLDDGIVSGMLGTSQMILQYITIIIILLGGLIVAQKFGIYGAGAVMSMGKRMGKTAGKWSGRTLTGYDVWAHRAVSAAGTVVGKVPGFGKVGGMIKGKAMEMEEKRLTRRGQQLYKKSLSTLSDSELKGRAKDFGLKGLAAAQVMHERGTLKHADAETAGRGMELFKKFGLAKEARELESARVDLMPKFEDILDRVGALAKEDKLGELSPAALLDPRVMAAISLYGSTDQLKKLRERSKQYENAMLKTLDYLTDSANLTALKAQGIDPTDPSITNQLHFAHATHSGDVTRMSHPQKEEFAKKAGSEELKRLKVFDPTIALNIQGNKLKDILEKMQNGEVARTFARQILINVQTDGHKVAISDPYIKNLAA